MSDDIFADWKTERFIIADYEHRPPHIVILCDFSFWSENYSELSEWSVKNKCELTGMVVTIPNEVTLVLFVLRWG
jgi:hypothetical protein